MALFGPKSLSTNSPTEIAIAPSHLQIRPIRSAAVQIIMQREAEKKIAMEKSESGDRQACEAVRL